ncbi:high-affinity methionine permease [Fusarium denticulatum]|uniref:High-affinity methionine permease n=1 Tax=Fusarium denticulatum TaxID=48507 RepID=A0A8H5U6Y0_9HYPO|nr:high-affinity methionine permease [Fusarium denticulatum]
MVSWRQPFSGRSDAAVATATATNDGEYSDGSLKYVGETGGNSNAVTYQEATGAPVEHESPLGYDVGPFTIVLINVTMMIGTGIYSTPSAILHGTGSVGLMFIYWTLGYLLCIASGAVYLEFTAYFPSRSGSEVVFLEQAFPRPTWSFPTTFAVQSVLLSFGSSNAVVLATYLFRCSTKEPSNWETKGVALAGYTVACLCLVFNTKYAYWFQNAIGVVKILTLIFIIITGFVVLGGHTDIEDPKVNFRNAFEGTGSASAYGLTNALYRIIFSYGGYNNAFNLANEVKNPVQSLKKYAFAALTTVYVLYMFANVAWLSAVPKEELESSGLTAASLFFGKVLGNSGAVRGLNFLIALSAFGNIMAVIVGLSRRFRECGRQGVLPWTPFWVSTKPFGTPLGPYFTTWAITALMILAIPSGDAFNFVSDLGVYPGAAFNLAMAVGLYVVRWRRKRANLPDPEFKAWHVLVIFNILLQLFVIIMPWYPPEGGMYAGDVSFWYATYVVTGIGILISCGLYYYFWAFLLPKWKGYRLRSEAVILDNGVQSHEIRKVPIGELDEWEATHDVTGRLRQTTVLQSESPEKVSPRSSDSEAKV